MNRENLKKTVKTIPQKPGIYKFCNDFDQIIYIGKAINLRRRVGQYFTDSVRNSHERTQMLARSIADIKWTITRSELEALVLEDKLIKKHLPAFNVKQKQFRKYRYLLLTDDEFPTLKIVSREDKDKFDSIFGPFSDEYYIKDVLNVIYQYYHLRSCTRSTPVSRCSNYSLGLCKSPCSGSISVENYAKIVDRVRQFLTGRDRQIIPKLKKLMEEQSNNLEFEKAINTRESIKLCKQLMGRQQFFHKFSERNLLIKQTQKSENTFLFMKGNLIKSWQRVLSNKEFYEFYNRMIRDYTPKSEADWILLDRANVVYSWLISKRIEKRYRFLS